MNILMILNDRFPPDIRLEKEIPALEAAGHRVVVVASEDASEREKQVNFEIIRLRMESRSRFRRIAFKLSNLDFVLAWELLARLRQSHPDFKPDAVHVHDLLWAQFGAAIAEMLKAKLVLDFHENYPAALEAYKANRVLLSDQQNRFQGQLADTLYYPHGRWLRYERQMVQRADRVIVVVPEALDRFRETGQPLDKFFIVSNTEDPKKFKPAAKRNSSDLFTISYIGGGGIHRGIDTLIRSAEYITKRNFKIVIVGLKPGSGFRSYIEKIVDHLERKSNVELVDWVPASQVQQHIANSDLAAVPHNDFEHTQTTVPHKLFQYMAMHKPVLVSDVRPLKRIVEECQCGVVFKADSPESCGQKIEWMMNNREAAEQLGANGRKATEGPYHWQRDAFNLVKLYNSITTQDGGGLI